jgi:lysophospholipase L1-like esterase
VSFFNRHPTGVTFVFFCGGVLALSLAPVPEWMKPLDLSGTDHPVQHLVAQVLARPDSVPRPSQGYGAGSGGIDSAEEDNSVAYDDSEEDGDSVLDLEERATTDAASRGQMAWKMPPRPHFDRYAKSLGLVAAPLDIPCVQPRNEGCERAALDRFFDGLRAAETRTPNAKVRVIHYGDSLIASDKITDRVRFRLQERFGSGGRGFLLVRKFNTFQRGDRMGQGTGGWILDVITQAVLRDRFFGYTGASFTAQKAGEETVFARLGTNREMEVFYLMQPGGGRFQVLVEDRVVGDVNTSSPINEKVAKVYRASLPQGTKEVRVRATSPKTRLFGAVLETDTSGVVYESIGLPGATSEVWIRPERADFVDQLRLRDPALVVLMLGGNDGLMLAKRRTTIDTIRNSMDEFMARIQEAAPESDCMVVSPLEAVRAKADGRMIPKPEVLEVIALQRALAQKRGCAFWDMHASMGGEGSLKRWVQAGLMLADLIHPRSRGSDLLGEMMAESIMKAYGARFPPEAAAVGQNALP